MTPKPSDEELEERLLELALERELEAERQDLAPLVAAALEAERLGAEGDDMNTLAIGLDHPGPVGGAGSSAWARLNKNLLVNAAAVLLITAIGLVALNSAGLFDDQAKKAALIPTDIDDDSPEAEAPIKLVRNLAEVQALPAGITALECAGEDFDDAALLEVCASQPLLEDLKIWDSTVTAAGLLGLKDLSALQHLALPRNNYFSEAAWLMVTELNQLLSLDVSSFVGQTASIADDGPVKVYPKEGVRANANVLRRIAQMPYLQELRLQGVNCQDKDLAILAAGLGTTIEVLDISITAVSLEGLAILKQFPKLRVLDIVGVSQRVGNPLAQLGGLDALMSLSTGSAGMDYGMVDDERLQPLRTLPRLVDLDIQYSKLSSGALDVLADFPALKSLRIASAPEMSPENCAAIARIPTLKRVTLVGCRSLSDAMLKQLGPSPALEVDLSWSTAKVSDDALADFCALRPGRVVTTARTTPLNERLQGYLVPSTDDRVRFRAPRR